MVPTHLGNIMLPVVTAWRKQKVVVPVINNTAKELTMLLLRNQFDKNGNNGM